MLQSTSCYMQRNPLTLEQVPTCSIFSISSYSVFFEMAATRIDCCKENTRFATRRRRTAKIRTGISSMQLALVPPPKCASVFASFSSPISLVWYILKAQNSRQHTAQSMQSVGQNCSFSYPGVPLIVRILLSIAIWFVLFG